MLHCTFQTLPCAAPAATPEQKGEGVLINIGSVAALKGVPDEAAYAASKAGLRGWSQACYEVPAYAAVAVVWFLVAAAVAVMVCLLSVWGTGVGGAGS